MARPTDALRLAALDPAAVALEVDARVAAHLEQLTYRLGPGFQVRASRLARSDLAHLAAALTEYAQAGLPVSDWETHGDAADAAAQLVKHLWGRPVDANRAAPRKAGPLDENDADFSLDDDAEFSLDDAVGLVVVAAWARVCLARGVGLTARQLGALAGLDRRSVRELARGGELRLEGERPGRAPPREARRWLGARGVRGLNEGGRTAKAKR